MNISELKKIAEVACDHPADDEGKYAVSVAETILLNHIDEFIEITEAAWFSEKYGHHDTCGKMLAGHGEYNYPCSCGYDQLFKALKKLEEV